MEGHSFHEEAVFHLVSHEIKKEEQGLLDFAKQRKLPISFFSTEELTRLEGDFSHSSFVESITGVDCVCERSAMALGNKLVVKKTAYQGMTFALASIEREYRL